MFVSSYASARAMLSPSSFDDVSASKGTATMVEVTNSMRQNGRIGPDALEAQDAAAYKQKFGDPLCNSNVNSGIDHEYVPTACMSPKAGQVENDRTVPDHVQHSEHGRHTCEVVFSREVIHHDLQCAAIPQDAQVGGPAAKASLPLRREHSALV